LMWVRSRALLTGLLAAFEPPAVYMPWRYLHFCLCLWSAAAAAAACTDILCQIPRLGPHPSALSALALLYVGALLNCASPCYCLVPCSTSTSRTTTMLLSSVLAPWT
jgi:hypothetical protein